MAVDRHFKTIYIHMLKKNMWALTERLTWTFPTSYKVSLYEGQEWFVGNAYGETGVPIPMPTQDAVKVFLLSTAGIRECKG